MCAHNNDGAMGLIINQPMTEITLAEILRGVNLDIPDHPLPPVHMGGPVGIENAFILYSSDYHAESQMTVTSTVSLSTDPKILADISKGRGPAHYVFTLGYSGWGPGQLENELTVDGWLVLPAEDDILFTVDDREKWTQAARRHGIDITVFGDMTGSA